MSAFAKTQNKDDSDSDNEELQETVEVAAAAAASEPEEVTTTANSDVQTKYMEAAKIANAVLQEVMAGCVAGARVLDLCKAGDESIEAKCGAIFRNKVKGEFVKKGVAFPVCLSVNECVCNVSPLESDDQTARGMVLANDDMVKIDLGVHIDGYIAVVAHTVIVGTPAEPITGARAQVFHAASALAKLTTKMLKPGNTNVQVAEALNKVLAAFPGVNYLAGVTMHQVKRFVIDGNKVVNVRPVDEGSKVEVCTFEEHETYAVDICVSSGEGKARDGNGRTTVYKRNVDKVYQLKMQAARKLFNDINKRFPTMPFTLRALGDERQAKLGIRELVNHDLLQTFPVVYERPGDHVVHVRFTLLLLPSGVSKITGFELVPADCTTYGPAPDVAAVEPELAALMAEPEPEKKKRGKRAAKKNSSSAATATA